MGIYDLYEKGYKPIQTVLGQQSPSPNAVRPNSTLPDLSKIPTNKITPLTTQQQTLVQFQQQIVAEHLAKRSSLENLKELSQRSGVLGEVATKEIAKRGFTPSVTMPSPSAAQLKAATDAVLANTPNVTRSGSVNKNLNGGAAGVAVAGALLAKPVGDLGEAVGKAALPLVNKMDEALGQRPSPKAKEALAQANNRYKEALAKQSDNARINNFPPLADPPFTGGQSSGSFYVIDYQVKNLDGTTFRASISGFLGAISSIGEPAIVDGLWKVWITDNSGARTGNNTIVSSFYPEKPMFSGIRRIDNQPDTGGNPPSTAPSQSPPPPPSPNRDNWYYGNVPVNVTGDAKKLSDGLWSKTKPTASPVAPFSQKEAPDKLGADTSKNPDIKPVAQSSPSISPSPNFAPSLSSTGSGSISAPVGLRPTFPTVKNPFSGESPAYESPAYESPAFESKPFISGVSDPKDYGKPVNNFPQVKPDPVSPYKSPEQVSPNPPISTPDLRPKNTTPDNKPQSNDALDILGKLLGLTAIATATKLGTDWLVNNSLSNNPKIDNINNNTSPQAQQTNAKQGVCDAMQPSQCGYEGVKQATTEATNPIKDIANDNKGVLAGLVAQLLALAKLITDNFTKLFGFLDINAKVEAVKSTITLALTLHNALMLSSSLGTTLGSIIDNVLNIFGNTFRSSDGNQISASSYLGATVQQWIINVIGVENYAKLSEALALANRIYATGMQIVSTVQTILDSANSAIMATGINLAELMNGLRDESVVSPRAYGHKDASPIGNRATTLGRFEQLTTTISDFDTKAQNLVTITAAPIQIKDAVKQSKDDIKAFNDARDLGNQANIDAKNAKLEEIKLLKPLTEVTISKRDDDT